MDKDFLRTLSDLELVTLQYEARKNDDQVFVDDILIVLGEREKQSTPERLRYIRLSETEYEYEIVIQFDGGGAMLKIDKSDNPKTVAGKLRYFAKLIEELEKFTQ